MNRKFVGLVGVALAGTFLAATALAQNTPGTIVATGTEHVRVQPKAIRLVFEIYAGGKTAEQAVEQLQAQRETAVAKLKELGAEEDSIHSTPASLTREENSQPTSYPAIYYPPGTTYQPSGYGASAAPGYGVPTPASPSYPPGYTNPPNSPLTPSTYSPAPASLVNPPSQITPGAVPSTPSSPDRDDSAPPAPSQSIPSLPAPAPAPAPTTSSPTAPQTYAPSTGRINPFAQMPSAGNSPEYTPAVGTPPTQGVSQVRLPRPEYTPYVATSPTLTPVPSSPSAPTVPDQTTPGAAQPAAPQGDGPFYAAPSGVPTTPGPTYVPPGATYVPPGVNAVPPEVNYISQMTLTARWPIQESKPDNVALVVEKLHEKLVAAKLAGNDAGLTPPVNSAPGFPVIPYPTPTVAPYGYYVSGPCHNDGFALVYVGELSKSDRKTALAAALAKAKEQAAELADAAGCHLGSLASLSSSFQIASYIPTPVQDASGYANLAWQENEVSSSSPNLPEITVSATVHFQIAP